MNYSRVRRGSMAADDFTQIRNAVFRDPRLSAKAMGIFGNISTHRDGWGITPETISKQMKDGVGAIKAALRELECCGYLLREQQRNTDGTLGSSEYFITDQPETLENSSSAPSVGNPPAADPSADDSPPKNTNHKKTKNQEQPPPAPSARSADDVHRTTDGSSARCGNCGCAASDQTAPVADEVVEAAGAGVPTPQETGGVAGGVPGQRGAGGQQGTGRAKQPRKSPFTWELRQQIYAVEALLPAPLREALAVVLPHGHLPNNNRRVTAQSLTTRTVEQLGERAASRWISYGYERDHHDGLLRSPLGVVEELLRPTPYCPDPECEDGANVTTGQECQPCAERIEQRRRDRRAGRKVRTARPPRLYRDAEQCDVCDRPFPGDVPEDLVCTGCRAEMDRATAFVTGAPIEEPEPLPEDHPDAAYAPNGPSAEYRQRREELADAKHNTTNPPPF